MKNLIIAFLLLTCLLALQCGLLDPESPNGSLKIVLVPEKSDNNGLKKISETLSSVLCIVNKGSKEIYNSNLAQEGNYFNAEIKDLKPGNDYSVLLYGKLSNNSIIARGYKSAVNVEAGKQETVNIVWASFSPTLVSPANESTVNDDLPNFDWNDVNDATEYNLEIDDDDNFNSPNLSKTGITTSNYKVSSSLTNNEYYWRVRAKDGQNNWGKWSDVWSVTISVGTVTAPTFDPSPGTFPTAQDVTISCATSGTSIHFTTNGSDPTDSDPVITSGNSVHISSTTTLKAKAYKTGWTPSSIASGSYIITGKVDVPTFSPSPGTYSSAQAVTINCTTSGVNIYYTTNGSDPTESDEIYSSPVQISTTTTLKARAFKSGWTQSEVVSGTYTITGTVATPIFEPASGTYSTAQDVTISCTTSDAIIYYTLDNSEPTESSSVYSNPIHITNTTTLKARAFKSGWTPSSIVTGNYTITGTIATPTFSPSPGTYTTAQDVTINCTTIGATIYYTTNGSDPTENSSVYSSPIHIATTTTTLKARAFKSGWTQSEVVSGTYTITGTVATPIFEPASGTYSTAQDVTISCETLAATIHYTTDGSVPTETDPAYSNPVHISTTTTLKAKAFRTNWANSGIATGTYTIITPLEAPDLILPANYSTITDDSLHFDWSDVDRATSYELIVDNENSFGSPEINQTNLTSSHYTVISPLKNGTYYWKVRCMGNTGSFADWSDVWNFSIKIEPEDMVYVPAGELTMGSISGSPDEQPVHTVYLDGYYIDKYEVTNVNYAAYLNQALYAGDINANSITVIKDGHELIDLDDPDCQITYAEGGFVVDSGKENYPVVEVSWYGANSYANHFGKRLPTEAEWAMAARGTDQRAYPWGDELPTSSLCNFDNNVSHTTPVGQYSPNGDSPHSCCDMAGNVWEWCNDWYDIDYYTISPLNNPQGPNSGNTRVLRGGSWSGNGAANVRSANRVDRYPNSTDDNMGFRCVR